jgi:hypothetical protein
MIDNYLYRVISDWWWAKDFASYGGHIYSDKAPLGSFLGVPIYFILRFFTSDFNTNAYFVSLFTSGLLTSATAVILYDFGKYFKVNSQIRTIIALAFGLGSMAFFYGTVFFSHSITSFFGFTAFYLLFTYKHNGKSTKKIILSGLFSAFAVSSDYYAGIIAFALFAYTLTVDKGRSHFFAIPFLFIISLLFGYHWINFDDPFITPYFYSNLYDKFHSVGFYGMRVPDGALISNLISQLFSMWGFFFTNPIILLSIISLPMFSKINRIETGLIVLISAGLFFVAGSIGRFDAYSSRFLMPLVPFLLIPIYTLDFNNRTLKIAFYLLILISMVINLVGVDTFLPKIADINVIRGTHGNHNLLGEFLLEKGINLHHITIIPLLIVCAFIWKNEIYNNVKKINMAG